MIPQIVATIHCLDAAAAAARTTARTERSEAWQTAAVRFSGLCAQLVTIAAGAGHTGLLRPADRPAGAVTLELAKAARLLSETPAPEGVRPRVWTQLVLDVQTAAREATMSFAVGRSTR